MDLDGIIAHANTGWKAALVFVRGPPKPVAAWRALERLPHDSPSLSTDPAAVGPIGNARPTEKPENRRGDVCEGYPHHGAARVMRFAPAALDLAAPVSLAHCR